MEYTRTQHPAPRTYWLLSALAVAQRPTYIRQCNNQNMEGTPWDQMKKYRGRWWSSVNPEHVFAGVLRFDEGRPRLTITSPYIGQSFSALNGPPTILGILLTGEKVTLWDLQRNPLHHLKTTKPQIKSRRTFTYAVLGEHLGGHEDQAFKFSSYRLRGLLEFSERLKAIPSSTPKNKRPKYADAAFGVDGGNVAYEIRARLEGPRQLETSANWPSGIFPYLAGEDVRVTFECSPPAPATVHDSLLFDLQRLLSFTIGEVIPVEKEWLAISERNALLPVMRRDRVYDVKKHAVGNLFSFNMLVTLDVVDPDVLFPAWWKAVGDLYPATEIICSYNQGTRGVLESSVSSVIALAERIQGAIGPSKKRYEEGVYAEMRRKIKESFNDDPEFQKILLSAVGCDC